jgi:hypothetical protein
MSVSSVLYTLSSVPIFATRPFLAAFVTAALARWGVELPWIGDNDVVVALHGAPPWFQSGTCVAILLALALAEVVSTRVPEIRAALDAVDEIVKAGVSTLVTLAIIDPDTQETLDAIQHGGFGLSTLWALGVGAATYALAVLRRAIVEWVDDVDRNDDLGVHSAFRWFETSAVLGGLFLIVVAAQLAIVLSALMALGIWLFKRRAQRTEERARVPCAQCRAAILPHASECHACHATVAEPRAVGVFGQPKRAAERDPERHRFDLISRKRCPSCATRLKQRAVSQACPTCGRVTFANAAEFERYLDVIGARLPRSLFYCFLLGFVPILGVIPGVLYYRLNLVSGLRGYIPPLRGCFTRWFVRFVDWFLIGAQVIPAVGAIVLPFICWSTYAIHRRSLCGSARTRLAPAVAARPA